MSQQVWIRCRNSGIHLGTWIGLQKDRFKVTSRRRVARRTDENMVIKYRSVEYIVDLSWYHSCPLNVINSREDLPKQMSGGRIEPSKTCSTPCIWFIKAQPVNAWTWGLPVLVVSHTNVCLLKEQPVVFTQVPQSCAVHCARPKMGLPAEYSLDNLRGASSWPSPILSVFNS